MSKSPAHKIFSQYTEAQVERFMIDNAEGDPELTPIAGVFIDIETVEYNANREGTEKVQGLTCSCGCKHAKLTHKATFLPGHDQRLMGTLQFAFAEGLEFSVTQGGMMVGMTPRQYGEQVLSEKGLAKLDGYLNAAHDRTAKAGLATPRAEAPAPVAEEPPSIEGAETIIVKIGRWEKEAIVTDRDQDGNPFEVQYNDAKGNPIVTTKFKLV